MSDNTPPITEVPAFELLDTSRRQSHVDPTISVDGDLIAFQNGSPACFVDPADSVVQVYKQLSAVVGIDDFDQSRVRSYKIIKSVRRFFNRTSIPNKSLSDEPVITEDDNGEFVVEPSVRERVRVVGKIPGFRAGIVELLEWLHQPDEQIQFHRVEDVEFFDEDNPETWRKMHHISFTEMVERGKEIPHDPEAFSRRKYWRYEPLEIIALKAMEDSHTSVMVRAKRNPDAALKWFKGLNGERRINMLCRAALQLSHTDAYRISEDTPMSPQGKYLRDLLTMLADEALSRPFIAWTQANGDDGGVEMARVARVFKGTSLDKRLEACEDPELRITRTDEKRHPVRGDRHPRCLHTVLVRDRIIRRDIQAVLADQVDDDGDTLKSRVYGEILLSLLFMQEDRHMKGDEISAIQSIEHADPTERLARQLALGMIFTASNGGNLKSILTERFVLSSSA